MKTFKELDNFDTWSALEQDQFSISIIKGLVMDATREANSGHPGGPMSSADFAYILYREFLSIDPDNPNWFDRDRFILSGGHMSMLTYSLLYFCGWLKMDDLKNFRKLHSRTPGHPEVDIPGVECTTGPLGQGFAMGVGMAHAEAYLRNLFYSISSKARDFINHYTYVLATDGDIQEPVAMGAAALAGHLGLNKLIVYYDSNDAQISGKVSRSDSADYIKVFSGFNWNVQNINGHDHDAIRDAIKNAQNSDKPNIIIGNTIMAKGSSSMEGDHNTHGAPLPQDEINATKQVLGLPDNKFYCPNEIRSHFRNRFKSLSERSKNWENKKIELASDEQIKPIISICLDGNQPDLELPDFNDLDYLATRKAFGVCLDDFAKQLPNLVGGSADLEPSNYTGNFAKKYGDFCSNNPLGRNIAFGVREFPMAAMMNGISLHGGLVPFGGTFLVFADYERPALRLAAIQKTRVIHEFTHDSFFVGEDGPTHQPIEHIMSLRAIPDFNVFRPADAKETAVCFELALKEDSTPSALLLTRQGVPVSKKSISEIKSGVIRGGYIFHEPTESPELILIATGSEVSLAFEVSRLMKDKHIRVVSLPCWEIFLNQSKEYRKKVIPDRGCIKVSIEAGISLGWTKFVGTSGLIIGIDHYGASAPNSDLAEEFGFTPSKIEIKIREHLNKLL